MPLSWYIMGSGIIQAGDNLERLPYQYDLCRNLRNDLQYLSEKNGSNRKTDGPSGIDVFHWDQYCGICGFENVVMFQSEKESKLMKEIK